MNKEDQEQRGRYQYTALKQAIDALAAATHLRLDRMGQLLAEFSLSSWPPSLFPPAWTLLQGYTKQLTALGIDATILPQPPDTLKGRDRFLALHPVEGFALFFSPNKEIAEAIKKTSAWEFVPDPPYWRVLPIQGAGKSVCQLAKHYRFQMGEGVEFYAEDIDLNRCTLKCRSIKLSQHQGHQGFAVSFPKSPRVQEQVKDILGRKFVEHPDPHWWIPAEPYQAHNLFGLAGQGQFSIDPEALLLLEDLNEQASHLPPQPPVRRIEYAEPAKFWIYFPPNQDLRAEMKSIPGAHIPKENNSGKGWQIPATGKAASALSTFAVSHPEFSCLPTVHMHIRQWQERAERITLAATAHAAPFDVEGLGGELRPRQLACLAYAQQVDYRLLIGDEVGVGKTPEALGILHITQSFPALIIVQASLKYNWEYEVKRWLPKKHVKVLETTTSHEGDYNAEVIIINYDLLAPRLDAMKAAFKRNGGLKALIADESHLLKTQKSQRTRAALALAEGVPVRLALSGTPILNRPIELVPQLEFLDRISEFGGSTSFIFRYCNPHLGRHGWDFNGASNTEELHQLLKEICYIRRRKKDVMPELPPIQEEMLRLEITNRDEYLQAEHDTIGWLREQVAQDHAFQAELASLPEAARPPLITARQNSKEARAREAMQLARIEALKQVAVRGKLTSIHTWIDSFLEETDEKLVLFAHHIEVQQQLVAWYPDSARVLGGMEAKDRFANITRFQDDPDCRLIVCSLLAAKEGITLTAASNVALLELYWRPADIDQPIGRAHRETQKASSITLHYLLAAQTIEVQIARLIEAKRKVVDSATDGTPLHSDEPSVFEELLTMLLQGSGIP